MALFNWDDSTYTVFNKDIDIQHKKLVNLLNDLHEAMAKGKTKDVTGGILKELVSYTKTHFTYEERLLKTNNYHYLKNQESEHTAFVNEIEKFQSEFLSGKVMISIKLMNFLKDWLQKHIKINDRKYGEYFKSNGVFK